MNTRAKINVAVSSLIVVAVVTLIYSNFDRLSVHLLIKQSDTSEKFKIGYRNYSSFTEILKMIPDIPTSQKFRIAHTNESVLLGLKDVIVPDVTPSISDASLLFPKSATTTDDRILLQLAYVPRIAPTIIKRIFMYHSFYSDPDGDAAPGQEPFMRRRCKVTMCWLSHKLSDMAPSDIMILDDVAISDNALQKKLKKTHRKNQIWVYLAKESAIHSRDPYGGRPFNWTMTYTPSSTIPAVWAKFYAINPGITTLPQRRNYASGKDRKVIWFVSNCQPSNSRNEYANELKKYIHVDVFGKCGQPVSECSRSKGPASPCFRRLMNKYKFYLSFENSNCNSYLSEKLFINGFGYGVLPIVMGALKSYYQLISPPHSFIHVEDFENVKDLADYLHKLDRDDNLYNEYFRWKGAWRLLPEENLFCRICAMAHTNENRIDVTTFKKWRELENCNRPLKYKT